MDTPGSTCTGWESLEEELAAWADSGRVATFWWRDDDAAGPTEALGRLCGLASSSGIPLTLAVIPGRLRPGPAEGLAEALAEAPTVRVAQHGFDHTNHAAGRVAGTGTGGASELCLHRGMATVLAELADGWSRLEAAFPGRLVPLLVPPWNRIDGAIVGELPRLGYRGLSTFGRRPTAMPAPGLIQVNAHCDPIRWKEGRRFAGLPACLGAVVGQLRASRLGPADAAEPVGLLTHHLDLDAEAWAFTAAFLDRIAAHPAAAFAAVDALLTAG